MTSLAQSPLMPYANARLLFNGAQQLEINNGRLQAINDSKILVKCFMKRCQYSGVSSGSKKLPLESQLDGRMMPGVSGDQFYYRGYALQYAEVSAGAEIDFPINESALIWQNFTGDQLDWMSTGQQVQFRFGKDQLMFNATVERFSGIFGGEGIDQIIYKEINGIQIQVSGGEIQN